MIKCIWFLKKKEGMSDEEFHRYWRDVHAPIADKIPGIRKYILCFPLPSQFKNGNRPVYDGIAEIWFDSEEAYAAATQTNEWKVSGEDGPVFIAPGGQMMVCGEDIIR